MLEAHYGAAVEKMTLTYTLYVTEQKQKNLEKPHLFNKYIKNKTITVKIKTNKLHNKKNIKSHCDNLK